MPIADLSSSTGSFAEIAILLGITALTGGQRVLYPFNDAVDFVVEHLTE